MAQRTKRARMLYKLMDLLGPEIEQYIKEEGEKPYTFTGALNQTLAIYGYSYWGSNKAHTEVKEQLIKDFKNLKKQISDEVLNSEK